MAECKVRSNQRVFVDEYLVDLNATQAAIRAGYSEKTAGRIASQNLSKLDIQSAIAEAMEARSKRTEITQDRVLTELARLGFSDLRKTMTTPFKFDGRQLEARWRNVFFSVPRSEPDGEIAV